MNISAAIRDAAEALQRAGVAESRREAASLLIFVLEKDQIFLIAHPEYELTKAEANSFDAVIRRRAAREPFQYIVGHQEFYGMEFEVAPGVLIPRPETEILVGAAIEMLFDLPLSTFYEIGVGSGCVAVSILNAVPNAGAIGVDISKRALAIAGRNAERHHVVHRLTLREADVFEGLSGKFDLIVSNPPYIAESDIRSLEAEVVGFEPHTALFGGTDGLSIIRRIVVNAPQFLKATGFLLMEIGFGQAANVKDLFDELIWKGVEFLPDHKGISRIVRSQLRG
ncbi:MAG: peptide chain release factor N(5)-glutamine methyltransferase [Pyrinomonadaceae bacterium]